MANADTLAALNSSLGGGILGNSHQTVDAGAIFSLQALEKILDPNNEDQMKMLEDLKSKERQNFVMAYKAITSNPKLQALVGSDLDAVQKLIPTVKHVIEKQDFMNQIYSSVAPELKESKKREKDSFQKAFSAWSSTYAPESSSTGL